MTLSNCCYAPLVHEVEMCSECGEHCEKVHEPVDDEPYMIFKDK